MNIFTKRLIYNHKTQQNVKDHPHFSAKHSHTMYEIIFFEKGDANYIVEGRLYKLKKNDLIFTRPLNYHYIAIQSNAEYSRFNIAFDDTFIEKEILDLCPPDLEVINCPQKSIIADIFNKLDFYSEQLPEPIFAEILQNLLKEVFYNLSFYSKEVIQSPSELSPIITRALAYINRNLFTLKNVKEVCEHLHVSEPYFFKLFKLQMKIPPKQYINLKRLQYAQKLLQCGKKASEVFVECGFESYVGFYKQYVKTFGYSPSKETPNQ